MEGSTPTSNIAAVQPRAVIDDDDSRSSASFGGGFEHRNVIESETLLYDSAKLVVEYEWPENSGNFYFIEEYLANYLGIRNLRRVYPELERRNVSHDMFERDHLRQNMMVNDLQCDLGVIAIPSQQVREVVFPNHKQEFEAYQHVKQAKKYGEMVEAMRKNHSNTTISYLESPEQFKINAVRACADWNARLNKQSVKRRPAKPIGAQLAPASKMGCFPVAVFPGQYIDTPQRYSSEKLKHYPLNTVLRGPTGPPKSGSTVAATSKNKESVQKHPQLKVKSLVQTQQTPTKYLDASALQNVVNSLLNDPIIAASKNVPKDSVESGDSSPSESPLSTSADSNGSSLFELVVVEKKKKNNVEG